MMVKIQSRVHENRARDFYAKEGWEVFHGGAPDFLLRRERDGVTYYAFAEAKSGHDQLKRAQKEWFSALMGLGARVDLARVHKDGTIEIRTPISRVGRRFLLLPTGIPAPRLEPTVTDQPQSGAFDCLRCGHRWISRVTLPLECPRCKTRRWTSRSRLPGRPPLRLSSSLLTVRSTDLKGEK